MRGLLFDLACFVTSLCEDSSSILLVSLKHLCEDSSSILLVSLQHLCEDSSSILLVSLEHSVRTRLRSGLFR